MEKISEHLAWIQYKDKQILYTDWTNMSDAKKFADAVKASSHHVIEMKKYHLLELIDVTNSRASTHVLMTMKTMAMMTRRFNKKKAVIGINSFERMLLDMVNTFASEKIKPFEKKEDALAWLADDLKN